MQRELIERLRAADKETYNRFLRCGPAPKGSELEDSFISNAISETIKENKWAFTITEYGPREWWATIYKTNCRLAKEEGKTSAEALLIAYLTLVEI